HRVTLVPVDAELDVLAHGVADRLHAFRIGLPIPPDLDLQRLKADLDPSAGPVDGGIFVHDPDRHVGRHSIPSTSELGEEAHPCPPRRPEGTARNTTSAMADELRAMANVSFLWRVTGMNSIMSIRIAPRTYQVHMKLPDSFSKSARSSDAEAISKPSTGRRS